MTYIRFETPEAKYILAPRVHGSFNRAVTPQAADAFVIESIEENDPRREFGFLSEKQYCNITEHARQNQKPIFKVDASNKMLHPSSIARNATLFLTGLRAFLTPVSNSSTNEFGPVRETLRKVLLYPDRIVGVPLSNMRSAIAADRIVRQVVPVIRRETGRKPIIFITYGVGHSDLPEFLKNHNMRRRFLARFTPLSRYFHMGVETKTIRYYNLPRKGATELRLPPVQPGHQRDSWEVSTKGTVIRTIIPAELPSYKKRTVLQRIKSNFRLARRKLFSKK